jgi:hypothetical protein
MAGDYPSTDFVMTEDGVIRRIVHRPSGMTIVTIRLPRDPVAVPSAYTLEVEESGSKLLSGASGELSGAAPWPI